jgi:response regulator RpfG family c-di-GMP phosphodiesterase
VSWEAARGVIRDAAGTQFDPAVVAAYDGISDETFARLRDGAR